MIIVNIRVPALEKVYNFSLEEKARIGEITDEVIELVMQKEGVRFQGEIQDMTLCSVEKELMCSRDCCLSDYGIRGGEELILV